MGSVLSDSDRSRPIFEIQPHAHPAVGEDFRRGINIQQGLRRGYRRRSLNGARG